MSKTVKIITDSAADLPDDVSASAGIDVVPLSIRFDTEELTDGIELTHESFWERIASSAELPSTSAPSPGAFEGAFRRAKEDDFDAVIFLAISSKISGTYQIAINAAETVKDVIPVHVIDTQACTLAESTICLQAAKLANEGKSAKEIVDEIEHYKNRVHLAGALDTLENLKKGGRIGAAAGFFGSLLSIRPIIGLVNGEVKPVARARTRSKAMEHLINVLVEAGPIEQVSVGHSYAPDIDEFLKRVKAVTNQTDVPVSIIGPVVGTHAGPRLLAISWVTPK